METKKCFCFGESKKSTDSKKIETFKRLLKETDKKSKEKSILVVDFGKVTNCKSYIKTENLPLSRSSHEIIYSIKRHSEVKPLQEAFTLDRYEGILKGRKDLKLNIKYFPTIPFQKNLEMFEYVDSDFRTCKIILKGESIGPICQISSKQIILYRTKSQEHLHSTIEIKNISNVPAEIQVDLFHDKNFQITPHEVTIQSSSYQYFNVKFRPQNYVVFGRSVHFLVLDGLPLSLDLIGISTKNHLDLKTINFKKYASFQDRPLALDTFLNDCLAERMVMPPFSLSEVNLNFGKVIPGDNSQKILITSLKNHMRYPIEIEWPNGDENFEINPRTVKIFSNENSAQFECKFRPTQERKLYFRSFVAQIYWIYEKSICEDVEFQTVPLNCEIRMQGDSFPETESWLGLLEVVPEVVTLPPCLPGHQANRTFKLQNKGHLPVAYRLIGPKKCNFSVKPSMGRITTSEIITVQLMTEEDQERRYIEEWKLITNGKEENAILVYFQGEAQFPKIEIGNNNKIDMGKIQEGTLRDVLVPFKNKNPLNLRYSFQISKELIKFVHVNPPEGEIGPFEQTDLNLICLGSECAPNIQTFVCSLQVIENQGARVGELFDTRVEVQMESDYSELCSIPKYHDFGIQSYKNTLSVEFDLYNFGETNVFFAFDGEDRAEGTEKLFEVTPKDGAVGPGGSVQCRVEGKVLKTGKQNVIFSYKNRIDGKSRIFRGKNVKVFEIFFECEIAVLQVVEILDHTFGPLFSKIHIWNFLKIEELNKIFKNLRVEKIQKIYLTLPECEEGPKIYAVTLALKNISRTEEKVKIRRNKICDCVLKEAGSGFHTRKMEFDCPHREMLKIELSDTTFYENQVQFLTIYVKYSIPYQTDMCYILEQDHNRIIELYFQVSTIPENTWKVSCYTPGFSMEMESIFIGTKVAPVQIFWIYNNTSYLINYNIQTEELEQFCKIQDLEVIQCVKAAGKLLPYNTEPLMFKFLPAEEKKYEFMIKILFQLNENSQYLQDFQITGNGTTTKSDHQNAQNLTFLKRTYLSNVPIMLSQDYIEVGNMAIWSTQTKLIFIRNNSKNDYYEYVFSRVFIENILEITVDQNYGIIKPKETHPILIQIKTFAEPCLINVLMACEIMNYTNSVMYKKSLENTKEIENKLPSDCSCDKGDDVKNSKNPTQTYSKPEPQNLSLTIGINSIHTRDLDTFMSSEDQLKMSPQFILEKSTGGILNTCIQKKKRLSFPEWETEENLSNEKCLIFSKIFEKIISDFLFSESFKTLLKIIHESPNAYYSQFIMDHSKIIEVKPELESLKDNTEEFRKKEIIKFYNQPSPQEILKILEKLVYDSVLFQIKCSPMGKLDINEIIAEIEAKALNEDCKCVENI